MQSIMDLTDSDMETSDNELAEKKPSIVVEWAAGGLQGQLTVLEARFAKALLEGNVKDDVLLQGLQFELVIKNII